MPFFEEKKITKDVKIVFLCFFQKCCIQLFFLGKTGGNFFFKYANSIEVLSIILIKQFYGSFFKIFSIFLPHPTLNFENINMLRMSVKLKNYNHILLNGGQLMF